jgi:hypothetical protein
MRTEQKLIAAGKVLDVIGKDAKVATVTVDGKAVEADAARAAFAKATAAIEAPAPADSDSRVGRVLDKVEDKIDSIEAKLRSTGLGNKIADFVKSDPEHVSSEVLVHIELANGEHLHIPVRVVDVRSTAFLQRLSMFTEAAALTPVVGQLASAATATASAIASVVAFALGDRDLGKALLRTAGKQVAMVGIGFIPVISNATSALAAIIDRGDLKKVRAASVADVVNLGAPAQSVGSH